ncbi:sugar ABC transporter substrate-binding protein [Candidatus Poriferisodalis sp.]|uniref:sugar ABC transporter substrate-binding protein n=1 Tax=Candidatus Poriferisodalis sp. TaxID=3101277 RepID=UPI003B01FF83
MNSIGIRHAGIGVTRLKTLTALLALIMTAWACSGTSDDSTSTTAAAPQDESTRTTERPPASTTTTAVTTTTTQVPRQPPQVAELPWGNFTLAERIVGKLERGDELNFVLSLREFDEPGAAKPLKHGWSSAGAETERRYQGGINARVVGPVEAGAADQAATIEALITSGDIDCLAVDAASPAEFSELIDAAVSAGIPVFGVRGDTPNSRRFAHYGIDAVAAGRAAGTTVGQWAVDGGILVRRAALLSSNAGDQQSFDLMRGFVSGLAETHSGVEWANEPTTALSHGDNPSSSYGAIDAWVAENGDVDIVFHTDAGLEEIAAVIASRVLYGDMYAVGFHISEPVTDFIRERVIVTAMTQGFAEQAERAGRACGEFLVDGVFETGRVTIAPSAVTRDNVDARDWAAPENQ